MAHQRRFPQFLREVEFFTNETDVQLNVLDTERPLSKSFFDWCQEKIPGLAAGEYIDYPSGADLFQVGSRSFFQVNRLLTGRLAEAALQDAAGRCALDLYAGVGLMTLPLARHFNRVVAVDSSPRAVRSLQFNAERAGLEVKVVNLNVEEYLPSCGEAVDFLVADPPRAGLGPRVTAELLRLRAARLALVSCDPATLARDLAALTAGGYTVQKITLVDMFPQTFHIESVVDLRLSATG
jgi:23S rRNA (uracil1939-C5)-methyltransferase